MRYRTNLVKKKKKPMKLKVKPKPIKANISMAVLYCSGVKKSITPKSLFGHGRVSMYP